MATNCGWDRPASRSPRKQKFRQGPIARSRSQCGENSVGSIASFSILSASTQGLFLREQLVQKLFQYVVAHHADIGIRLAVAMKHRGGGLIDGNHLHELLVSYNQGLQRFATPQRLNF